MEIMHEQLELMQVAAQILTKQDQMGSIQYCRVPCTLWVQNASTGGSCYTVRRLQHAYLSTNVVELCWLTEYRPR